MRRPMSLPRPVAAAAMLWLLVAAAPPVEADEVRSLALAGELPAATRIVTVGVPEMCTGAVSSGVT